MSQEPDPNTPKAANNTIYTTADPIPSPTPGVPPPLFSGHLPPSQNPDFPRRSSSLQTSSPGAPSPKTKETSMQVSDGMGHVGNEGQVGDNLGSEGKGLDGSGRSDMDNAKEKIEEFDWEGLEEQFYAKMEECRRVEEGLMGEFGELVEVFNAWATAGAVGEEERAGKRLRTRIEFVKLKEQSLEEKRLHYVKVVQAFESALALLSAA